MQKYAYSKGFGVVKYHNTKDDEGNLKRQIYACSRAGTRKANDLKRERKRPSTSMRCPMRVSISRESDNCYKIIRVKLEHNHDISPKNSRFISQHRKLEPHVRRRLELFDAAGVKTSKSVRAIATEVGGAENTSCLPKNCRNHLDRASRLRLKDGDTNTVHKLFLRMQDVSRDFHFEIDTDGEGRIQNAFWVDARSRVAYKEFNDVVTFDTTYLLNKHKMPFAPFVGVNHHGHSILLGCALLSNEDIETFGRLFSAWMKAMDWSAPNVPMVYSY